MTFLATLLAALLPVLIAGAIYLVVTARKPVPPARQRSATARRPDFERRLVRAVLFATAVGIPTRWPVAALAAGVLGWYLPEALGSRAAVTASLEKTEAVATWTEMLRDTVLGPAGLEGAIEATAPLAPAPIRRQVAALAARLPRQRPAHALAAFADDVDHPVADLVVAALALSYRCPSSELGPLLSALADSARAEAAMRLRVDTARARMRTAVRVIVAAMGVTAGGLALASRPFLEVYATASGQAVLAMIALLWAWGLAWLSSLAHLAEPERFFSSRPAPSAFSPEVSP